MVFAVQTTHDSRPEEPKKDVRLKQYTYATFLEEIETGENPITKETKLCCSTPQLPRLLVAAGIQRSECDKFFTKMVEKFTAKFEHDNSEEIALVEVEGENEEKLNMGNTLKKVFSGSKFYIFMIYCCYVSGNVY